jgi:hypothetical protein
MIGTRSIAILGVLAACRSHTRPRAEIDPSNLLPRHGVLYTAGGMGGESRTVIDFDARTLQMHVADFLQKGHDHDVKRTLTASQVAELKKLGDAAWREAPGADMPQITDVGVSLTLLDGDDGFYASGTEFGRDGWRVDAGKLVQAIDRAAE